MSHCVAGCKEPPRSARILLPEREPDGSRRQRGRECDRLRFGPATRCRPRRIQRPSPGCVGLAYAEVPERFHPRHAIERWYRYHLFDNVPVDALREAGSLFVGEHDFRHFTSDPPPVPFAINRIDVAADTDAVVVDVHARSFRRGMVRRIVAAMLSHARGDGDLERIRAALRGERQEFGAVPPEPLFLMDVDYGLPLSRLLQPKVFDESQVMRIEARLRLRWLNALADASSRSRKA